MQIYLPIAEMSADVFLLLAMGGGVGLLSGLFGVGGGFLLTPLLIFAGIPAGVAVGTAVNQVAAASVSGALAHWRRGNVDIRMGLLMLAGGLVGALIGVSIFTRLKELGQIDVVIPLSYVFFLGGIGLLMLGESLRALVRARLGAARPQHSHYWIHRLPFKMRFPKSRLYISAIPPLVLGAVVGMMTAIMGVGGGFFLVPAMIYLLGMPTVVAIGTSLFQIIFVATLVTFLQAVTNQNVDAVLALLLLTGGVIGAQFGTRLGSRLGALHLRGLLALLVIGVAARLAVDLVVEPGELFTLTNVVPL
jgi:uncharacterized membrane protein YfcA